MNIRRQRATLQRIAHQAMLDRGLMPDFSPEALAELDRMPCPAYPLPVGCYFKK